MKLTMIIFLSIFLCLYGGINLYAFSRAKSVFHFSGAIQIIVIVSLIFLVLAPFMVRIAESRHLETLACLIAFIGYLWMAFIFLFFFLNVTLDFIRYLSKFFSQGAGSPTFKTITFVLAVSLSLIFVVYGFFDAQKIRVKRLEFNVEKLTANNGKIRIVQISDVHIGLIIREKRLQSMLKVVQEENPDILVSTGDLLDGELDNVMLETGQLAQIKPKFGKYAITGNHEYYAGIKRALEFTQNAGFEILRDEDRQVAGINIIGVDDITGRTSGITRENPRLTKALSSTQGNGFTLLLKHQPYVHGNDNFNLQLSGHTHGGQIFPFGLITHLFFPKNYGFYELGKNKALYVSRGVGTWGPPVRIFAPPEITVIDLIGKKVN